MSRNNGSNYLRWIMKLLIVNVSSFCMLIAPIPLYTSTAQAQSVAAQYGPAIINFAKQASQSYFQAKQQSFDAINQANIFNNLRPESTPDKFFGCPIPKAISSFPSGACSGAVTSAQQMSEYNNYATVAEDGFLDFYNKMDTPGNTRFPIGFQCIEKGKKEQSSAAIKRINQLTALQDMFTKNNQQFRDANKGLLNNITDLNSELNGTGDGGKNSQGNINTQAKDLSGLFSPACKETIKKTGATNATAIIQKDGLLGLKIKLDSFNEYATRYKTNASSYERDLNKRIQKIKKDINRDGVNVWVQRQTPSLGRGGSLMVSGAIGQTSFKPASLAVADYLGIYSAKKKNYTQEITSRVTRLNIKNPTSRENVTDKTNLTGLNAGEVETLIKKDYINKCVTLNDRGIGIDLSQVIGSMRHDSKLSNPAEKYKTSFTNIMTVYDNLSQQELLNQPTIQERLKQLKDLDNSTDGKVTFTYKDASGNVDPNKTPYQMLSEAAAVCESKYKSSVGPEVVEIKKNFNALKRLESDFAAEVVTAIENQVRSCGGNSYKTSSCSSDMLNPGKDSFCLNHAQSCANQMTQCFAQVQGEVVKRTKMVNQKANSYNQNVEIFVANQENVLKKARAIVSQQAEILRAYFPGGDFELPQDLLIEMPPLEDSEYGVRLRGKGELAFVKALPEKLEGLKDAIRDQQVKIDTAIQDYIDEQRKNLNNNKTKWANLARACTDATDEFARREMERYGQQSKEFKEGQKAASEFCSKYGQLRRSNPAAGCNEGSSSPDKLSEEAAKISSHLAPEVSASITEYRNFCAGSQNEKTKGEDDDEDDTPILISMCNEHGDWAGVKDEVISNLAKNSHNKKGLSQSKIEKYLNGKISMPSGTSSSFKKILGKAKSIFGERSSNDDDDDNDSSSVASSKYKKARKKIQIAFNKLPSSIKYGNAAKVGKVLRAGGIKDADSFEKLSDEIDKLASSFDTISAGANTTTTQTTSSISMDDVSKLDTFLSESKDSIEDMSNSQRSNASDEDEASTDMCQLYEDVIDRKTESCTAPGGGECGTVELEENKEKYYSTKFDSLPVVGNINKKLRSIASEVNKHSADDRKWNRIGQHISGKCFAQADPPRSKSSSDFFADFDRAAKDGKEDSFMNFNK